MKNHVTLKLYSKSDNELLTGKFSTYYDSVQFLVLMVILGCNARKVYVHRSWTKEQLEFNSVSSYISWYLELFPLVRRAAVLNRLYVFIQFVSFASQISPDEFIEYCASFFPVEFRDV